MHPNQKPWRVWYSADGCQSWRNSRASFGTCSRAVSAATEMVGPRLLQRLRLPLIAMCAIHSGTHARSEVHYLRPEQVHGVERPVVVQLHHGHLRPSTLTFGYAMSSEIERRQKTDAGPVTLRRHVQIAPTLRAEEAAVGVRGHVLGDEVPATTLRGVGITKIIVCTRQAMDEWEQRKKIARVRRAIDQLACTNAERAELVEMLYAEDLGSRLDTETPEQIAAERLKWLREQIDG